MNQVTTPKKLYHDPVLLREVLEEIALAPKEGWIVDGTFGDGGHSKRIYAQRVKELGLNSLLSVDWDFSGYTALSTHTGDLPVIDESMFATSRWVLIKDNFAHLESLLKKVQGSKKLAVLLLDLGISSRQYVQKSRGFSFSGNGKVDMRMDADSYSVAAYDLLNILPYKKLSLLFRNAVGMNPATASILAKEIIIAREKRKFGNNQDISRLNEIAYHVMPLRAGSVGKIHPATLLFLALRIAVNTELHNLKEVLPVAYSNLLPSGKLLLMTYHSGEEQVVQQFLQTISGKKAEVILPSPSEIRKNPRARSAKLYVVTK